MTTTNIKGEKIILRAVEPEDVAALYEWENMEDVWSVSGTTTPFSHHTLAQFIESQRQDIYASRQLRLMICRAEDGVAVGVVDLFEFEPQHHRVGVGILIAPPYRRSGYGADALRTVAQYAAKHLRVHQIWCNVEEDNLASIALFTSLGYCRVGVKREWNLRADGTYSSEILLQLIFS